MRRPHAVRRAIGLAGVALLGAAMLTGVPQQAVTGWNQGSAEATLWQLMNGARVANGRRAVVQHGTLVSLARWRSRDQVQRNYFSHTILGTGYEVYHWYDQNGLQYQWGGENIGWNNGYADADSPVAIHEGFMNSPGHRANVLEPSFTHGGVGAYAADNVNFLGKIRSPRFYTELFMVAASAPPPPPPPPSSPPPPSNDTPAPPPPPSGGGTATAPSQPVARPTRHRPQARPVRVDSVAAPRASRPLDGARVVATVDRSATLATARAMARTRPLDLRTVPAASSPASPMRVEAATAADGGLVETVVGSLLGFVL
ncbi:MAG TPA: CAP domain-containing protein [Candidatus Limnocylindria bacterium]|nr:CAP domain-containing protein [Candidatus Limnocylindria bacterium]